MASSAAATSRPTAATAAAGNAGGAAAAAFFDDLDAWRGVEFGQEGDGRRVGGAVDKHVDELQDQRRRDRRFAPRGRLVDERLHVVDGGHDDALGNELPGGVAAGPTGGRRVHNVDRYGAASGAEGAYKG